MWARDGNARKLPELNPQGTCLFAVTGRFISPPPPRSFAYMNPPIFRNISWVLCVGLAHVLWSCENAPRGRHLRGRLEAPKLPPPGRPWPPPSLHLPVLAWASGSRHITWALCFTFPCEHIFHSSVGIIHVSFWLLFLKLTLYPFARLQNSHLPCDFPQFPKLYRCC